MSSNLFGKDINLKVLEELDDKDLFSFCLVDKYANELCKNEHFWRKRFLKRFGKRYDKGKSNWRKTYLSIVKDLYTNKPWDFFDNRIFANMQYKKGKGFEPHPIQDDFTFNNYYYLDLTNDGEVAVNFFTESDTYIPKKYKILTPHKIIKEINRFYEHRNFMKNKYFNGFLYMNDQYYLLFTSE